MNGLQDGILHGFCISDDDLSKFDSRLILMSYNVCYIGEMGKLQSLILETKDVSCHHRKVREIGQDFDKDGQLLRLVRCQICGLLMREYLLSL